VCYQRPDVHESALDQLHCARIGVLHTVHHPDTQVFAPRGRRREYCAILGCDADQDRLPTRPDGGDGGFDGSGVTGGFKRHVYSASARCPENLGGLPAVADLDRYRSERSRRLQAVRHAGAATVVVTDVVPWRLEQAAALGASETILADEGQAKRLRALAPLGYDIVADATGRPDVLEGTFAYVRPRGKVWVFGVCPPGAQASFVPYDLFRKDLSIIGSFAVCRTFQESIALIQSGAVRVEPLISHRLPLEGFGQALELAEHGPDRMKVQFALFDGP